MKLRAPIVMSPEMEDDYEDVNYGSLMRMQPSTETTRVSVEVNRMKLDLPKALIDDEEAAKEWIWQNCKSSILSSMTVLHNDEPSELDKAHKSLMLLDQIATVQQLYLKNEEPRVVFGTLLDKLLELMQSEYGFIGEIKHEADGTMYLQTHAITNIAWNAATHAFYEENKESGLKFTNLKSLFGLVMVKAEPLIANEPSKHPSACGIPEGHPPLNHFLGIPFFEAGGTTMTGMVGIANKPGGYSEEDIKFLEPFTVTCSNLIRGYNAIRENKNWINILEERVAERTQELQLANIHLEDANQKVVKASKAQLQHFACMSHEIRTPLNCIIGLSSLLQETDLNPYQNDSLRMIITSGDLLLTVVNDVLDYSKLESGHVDMNIKKSNLQEALDAVVHSVAQKAKSKQLTLQTYYGTNVPKFAQTDSRRLQQILYNLLGNAAKFSEDGGVVELHVSLIDRTIMTTGETTVTPAPACPHLQTKTQQDSDNGTTAEQNEQLQPEDRCPFLAAQKKTTKNESNRSAKKCPHHHAQEEESSKVDDASSSRASYPADTSSSSPEEDDVVVQEMAPSRHILRFMVKDYGIGIKRKDFGRIFKPFKQANSFTEQLYGGTGLGLAITAKLVKGLGGAIKVDSVEGEWSEFTIDFPCDLELPDTTKASKVLDNVSVLHVCSDEHDFEWENLQRNNLDCHRFRALGEIDDFLQNRKSVDPNRFYMYLVQEELFQADTYQRVASMAPNALLTFGPKYSVKESCGHFRSISQVLPSVLMKSLASRILADSSKKAMSGTDQPKDLADHPISYEEIKVLIAEDNLINQKVLGRMLSRIGVKHVDVVDNGQKAVDREAERGDYDIIFMDMQMPVMGGLEATQLIVKRRGENARPKIVFVTANVSYGFEEEAISAGGDGFISKPFNKNGIEKAFDVLRS